MDCRRRRMPDVRCVANGIPYYNIGFFYDYFQRAFGWSRAEITFAFPLAALLTVWAGPLLVPKFNPRLRIPGSGYGGLAPHQHDCTNLGPLLGFDPAGPFWFLQGSVACYFFLGLGGNSIDCALAVADALDTRILVRIWEVRSCKPLILVRMRGLEPPRSFPH